MPIFDLNGGGLIPFRREQVGAYEKEIEDLLWNNLEEITGDKLFRVARQPILPNRNRPDVIALDATGRIVVIEVKRSVDREQLAQALEYAGWARNSNLDELAGMYHGGPDLFWDDWNEFVDSDTVVRVNPDARVLLVARGFDDRTLEAMSFLSYHEVPINVIKVAFYVDDSSRRFLNVEHEDELEVPHLSAPIPGSSDAPSATNGDLDFREVSLTQVVDWLGGPVPLIWERPRKGTRYTATLDADGFITLPDGRMFYSPSGAAMAAADVVSYDGWYAWRTPDGKSLNQIRHIIADAAAGS
ncbi:restriction system modified-DNA reader domain-containing protein [Rhodococcoides kroppenstedtii]|uniref:restriction system modified-DNA reader domain-containing protein n=1 Tax=Rhodococcoides kroppenstedtii TaxID=293050 RepID=UPI003639A29C